jgi:hypothetical protein
MTIAWIMIGLMVVYIGVTVWAVTDKSSTAWAGKITDLKKKSEKLNKKIDKAYKQFELSERVEAEIKEKVREVRK